jgi:hypothetical protein
VVVDDWLLTCLLTAFLHLHVYHHFYCRCYHRFHRHFYYHVFHLRVVPLPHRHYHLPPTTHQLPSTIHHPPHTERKGLLHLHGILWTELDPMVISKHIHKKEFRDRVVKYVDSIITCDLDADVVEKNDMHRKTKQASIPYGMHEPQGLNAKNVEPLLTQPNNENELRRVSESIDREASRVNAATCFHKHTFTCFPKDGSAAAKLKCPKCRLDMGRGPSAKTKFVQAVWSKVKDPDRKGELATSVKIKNEWTFKCCGQVAVDHPVGTVVVQAQVASNKPFGLPVATGAVEVHDQRTMVNGTLKVALVAGENLVEVVVETTDDVGFNALSSLVIGTNDATTTVDGVNIAAATNTSEWQSRPTKACTKCTRRLEGGLYSATEYGKSKEEKRQCTRCCADADRCSKCQSISECPGLRDSEIDLLHATCLECHSIDDHELVDKDAVMGNPDASGGVSGDSTDDVSGDSTDGVLDDVTSEAREKYDNAMGHVLRPGGGIPIASKEYLQALELLKCRNIWGYHGTIADRLIEMKDTSMWGPMAAVAGGNLHKVIVTTPAAKELCEDYLKEFVLHNQVKYLVACELEPFIDNDSGGHDCTPGAESDTAAGIGGGRFLILADHFPRKTNASIERTVKYVFGTFKPPSL